MMAVGKPEVISARCWKIVDDAAEPGPRYPGSGREAGDSDEEGRGEGVYVMSSRQDLVDYSLSCSTGTFGNGM